METRSWMRKRTKLAGMKEMAKITQMDTTTSVEVVALQINTHAGRRGVGSEEGSLRWRLRSHGLGSFRRFPSATAS